MTAPDPERLSKEDRRLLDQFAYRYTRLQDDMGARFMPAALRAMDEEIAAMPMVDRLNRLEQLGWLPSAEGWLDLRRIRNEFAHDYPETPQERSIAYSSRSLLHARGWVFWTTSPGRSGSAFRKCGSSQIRAKSNGLHQRKNVTKISDNFHQ
ncbi:MAG: hypothetical protein ACOY4D_13390 [Pseudomonadota bacterium]